MVYCENSEIWHFLYIIINEWCVFSHYKTTASSAIGCCIRDSARTTGHRNHSSDFNSSVAEEVAIGGTEK